jgi:hypothetical protein
MDCCKENTWMDTLKGSNSPIEIAKFVMCGLCFFVHVIEYTIVVAKTFIVVAKTTMLSSLNGCNQNSMILFTFHLHFQ